MDNLDWLREHMRDHISKSAPIEPADGVLRFPSAATRNGEAALELVYQAAQVVRGIEDRANETENRARSLAEKAAEKLQAAEYRIQELEAEQRAAEACISEAQAKIRDAGEALKAERSRVTAVEDRLSKLEWRARTAEAHAKESEAALVRIVDAIQTQLLEQRRADSHNSAAAA